MTIFFSADHHVDHKRIIDLCLRPFKNVDEMAQTMLEKHNALVSDRDDVYLLGDISMKDPREFLSALNGRLHLVWGNHDCKNTGKYVRCLNDGILTSVQDYKMLRYNNYKFVLFHYPIESWADKHYGSIHLHGHCHGTGRKLPRRFDVGVDCTDFAPVSIDDVLYWVRKEEDSKAYALPEGHSLNENLQGKGASTNIQGNKLLEASKNEIL